MVSWARVNHEALRKCQPMHTMCKNTHLKIRNMLNVDSAIRMSDAGCAKIELFLLLIF